MAEDRFMLRPVLPSDYGPLYRLAQTAPVGFPWSFRTELPTLEQFREMLTRGAVVHYCVVRKDGELAGYVSAYDPHIRAGAVYVAVILAPEYRKSLALRGLSEFLRELFETWQFRKVYFDVSARSSRQFMYAVGRFLAVEGHVPEHYFEEGKYHDRYLLSVTRERWSTFRRIRSAGPGSDETIPPNRLVGRQDRGGLRWVRAFAREGVNDLLPQVGRLVAITPLSPHDLEELYVQSRAALEGYEWRFRNGATSLEAFTAAMGSPDIVCQLAVRAGPAIVGHAVAYFMDARASTARFSYFFFGDDRAPLGARTEGLVLSLRYLFNNWNFRHLVVEGNSSGLEGLPSAVGFLMEAVDRDQAEPRALITIDRSAFLPS